MPRRSARPYAPATSCAPTALTALDAARVSARYAHAAFVIYAKCVRGARRVQMRGAARPPRARRSRSTLSERRAGGNEAAGPFRLLTRVLAGSRKNQRGPRPGDWFCYPREARQGGEKGPDARRRPPAAREA